MGKQPYRREVLLMWRVWFPFYDKMGSGDFLMMTIEHVALSGDDKLSKAVHGRLVASILHAAPWESICCNQSGR
jgi:hypothetical protein